MKTGVHVCVICPSKSFVAQGMTGVIDEFFRNPVVFSSPKFHPAEWSKAASRDFICRPLQPDRRVVPNDLAPRRLIFDPCMIRPG